jgi:hypothetical protein
MATTWHEDHDHMVSNAKILHAVAQSFDDTRGLVSEHHWCGSWPVAFDHGKIRVAQSRGGNPDHDFTRPGIIDRDLLERERFRSGVWWRHAHTIEDRRLTFHAFPRKSFKRVP